MGAGSFLLASTLFRSVVTPCSMNMKPRYSVCSWKKLHFFSFSFSPCFLGRLKRLEYDEGDIPVSLRILECHLGMRWQTSPVLEELYSSALERLPVHYSNQMAPGWTGIFLCDMQRPFFVYFNLLMSPANIHSLNQVQWNILPCLVSRGCHQSTVAGMIVVSLFF